jgi:hypothetical protein
MNELPAIPEEFTKVIKDFVTDIQTTFPEFCPLISKWWKSRKDFEYIESLEERETKFLEAQGKSIQLLHRFCTKKFPPRFFDLLYQNEEIFKEDAEHDTEFLPHIHFKTLWELDISQKTKDTIWKYLQLILFSIIGNLENKESFGGDTAKLFEAINNEDFKSKLEQTLEQIQGLFQKGQEEGQGEEQGEEQEQVEGEGQKDEREKQPNNQNNFPNADQLHDHISGMMNGKLGQLAKEIAEETADSFNLDMENTGDMKDVFQKLLKNPTKLMGLVKNVGDKLDSKMKSGEIKESELMAEATEIFNRMKNTPGMGGMGDIQSMLSKMGLGGAGAKLNMGAMEEQMKRNLKMAQMKEKVKANIGKKNVPTTEPVNQPPPVFTEEQLIEIFEKENSNTNQEKTVKKKKDKSKKPKK